MLHVHTRFFGLDVEFCLQRAVRDSSQRSHAWINNVLQECAVGGLTLSVISLITVVTLVGVVTAVARNYTAPSSYHDIPAVTLMPDEVTPTVLAEFAMDDAGEQWAIQER